MIHSLNPLSTHLAPPAAFRRLRAARRSVTLAALAAFTLCAGLAAPAAALAATEPTTVHEFTGGTGGGFPYGTLLKASDGLLYGTTFFGSKATSDPYAGYGTLYRMKPDGSAYRPLHVFTGGADGGVPFATPIQGLDGSLYGTTMSADETGPSAFGTIYRLSKTGKFKTLYRFSGADGRHIASGLTQGPDGTLYGVAQGGGRFDQGTVFRISPDGSNFKLLHEFDGGLWGGGPRGVTLGRDGKLYGVTNDGGGSFDGTIFKINTDGSGFKNLHQFAAIIGEGRRPYAPMLQGPDGYFYGSTDQGGKRPCACGTVFRISTTGDFSTVHHFGGATDGSGPSAPLAIGPNGHLYGTTFSGGAVGNGTAWELDTQGRLVGLVPFGSAYPGGLATGLTLAGDGRFYGTSLAGGSLNVGTVYALDPLDFPAPAAR